MARKQVDGSATQSTAAAPAARGWKSYPFGCGLLSSVLLLLAFPPFGLWPLAFVAPTPLIWLVRKQQLSGPRPYRWLWLGAAIGWLGLLQGVRLPHPVLYLGWFALSFYVAAYTPIFVALARSIAQPWKLPLLLVAPIVWVALELARGYLFTGFSIGLASHPLIAWPELLQLAELGGAYAVSWIVVTVAASVALMLPCDNEKPRAWLLIPLTAAIGGAWLYGDYRLRQLPPRELADGVPVCLLQSNQDVIFVADPDRNTEIYLQCLEQAVAGMQANPQLRLIVWPESTFSANRREVLIDGKPRPPSYLNVDIEQEELEERLQWGVEQFDEHKARTARLVHDAVRPFGYYDEDQADPDTDDSNADDRDQTGGAAAAAQGAATFQLLGTQSERFGDHDPERLNTAVLMDPQGRTAARYHKIHRVMFGEYVPLGDQLPFIYDWTPMARGITSGKAPLSFELDKVRFSPTICFEITVPHLIRGQFNQLAEEDQAPDVLINVSNDGWFWGSSILDLHFACNVFRAVELRRTVLSSANTGVTAWVDDAGRVLARAPRRTESNVLGGAQRARVPRTVYAAYGDLPAALCLLLTLLATAFSWRKARRG